MDVLLAACCELIWVYWKADANIYIADPHTILGYTNIYNNMKEYLQHILLLQYDMILPGETECSPTTTITKCRLGIDFNHQEFCRKVCSYLQRTGVRNNTGCPMNHATWSSFVIPEWTPMYTKLNICLGYRLRGKAKYAKLVCWAVNLPNKEQENFI